MTTTDKTQTTYAIFAPEPQMQDAYGRRVRGVLMYVTQAGGPQEAFDAFDSDIGATGTTADDHIINEVPENWLDSDYEGYDYPEDEIL